MAVFNGDNYEISTNISIEHKLLKSVVLSFANKLYVEKFLSANDNKESRISMSFLQENGFV